MRRDRENRFTELCASEELFRGLSISCPAGIFRANLDGSVTYANSRSASIWDMPEEELLGFGWLSRIHPDDRDALINRWAHANSIGRDYDQEYRLLLPDGRIRWVHGRSAILHDRNGTAMGLVGTVDDVTERKQAERALRDAKAEAESANRLQDLFLANVSHELRTPLNGILGMLEPLLQSPLTTEQRQWAETVRQCGETLLSVVKDILDINGIEAGTLRVDAAPFDLRAVIDCAAAFVRTDIAAKGLQFSVDFPPALPARFIGDGNRIQQILLNFLTNAITFTDQGAIACEVRMEETAVGSRQVLLAVRDTGCGISKASQDKLFRPFSQVDASSTRTHGGVGLGLAISRRLAELMGGNVGVISAPDQGSTFWLKFELCLAPAELPAQMDSISSQVVTRAAHGGRALVAEDNAVNQRVIVRMLQTLGWKADIASDGNTALELALRNQYLFILMDCQMPGMDGYSVSSKIREHEMRTGRARTPIIAVTASAVPGNGERCLESGMDDYLAKPLLLDQLRQKLDRWTAPGAAPARSVFGSCQ